jgi:S-adenosylmethionine hydrolase
VKTPAAWFLAPDNGLLTPVLDGALSLRSVEKSELFLPGAGQTFHGRDRFAPVAAWLLRGEPLAALGPEIDDPHRLAIPPPRQERGRLAGRVAHVDRYGNLVTDIPAAWLPPGPCRAEVAGRVAALRASHYAEIAAGEAALLPGSLGTLELSLRGDDLARRWSVGRGAAVEILWNES